LAILCTQDVTTSLGSEAGNSKFRPKDDKELVESGYDEERNRE